MARGKYAKVLDQLPRMLNTEPSYQQKVEAVKTAIREEMPLHASVLAKLYAGIRAEKEQAEAAVSEINLRLEATAQLMTDQFEAEGVTSLKGEGFTVGVYVEPYASVQDHDALREWAIKDGLERKLALPWQTVNSLTKQRLLDGYEPPDGVTVFAKTKIRLGSE